MPNKNTGCEVKSEFQINNESKSEFQINNERHRDPKIYSLSI